jgi:two-component system sensor histidine kinase KdpD
MATPTPRPDPDQLLAHVQAEERRHVRGRLKVFLGYAAGVGKTYAMLEAAQQRKAEGVDVVIGLVETHGRAETEAMIEGLEVVPRRPIEYRGTRLTEMDLDALLARRPKLAVVDELAHANAPGSRHPKRCQDIEELLAAGIDVYTTLNIQHLESLNDAVAQITGVVVRETVPDSILDSADEIELVDLPPEELRQRLNEGKVYVPDQAARAAQKFFREGNLTALREMTLRRAAEQVDDQMRAYMQTRAIPGPWPAAERLLVSVSPSPLSERLVRSARRLADELNAEWFAVFVETPELSLLTPPQRDQVMRALQLAEELGATALRLPGADVAETLLNYARANNITKVVAGKPLRPRWRELLQGSVVDRLIRQSGPIDVYVISGAASMPVPAQARAWLPHRPLRRYVVAAGLVTMATLASAPLSLVLTPTNLVMLYLAAVVVAAVYLGRGPAILASILGVLAFDFFFVPPQLTFVVDDAQYVLTFIGLFLVGLVISTLAAQAREQAESARNREAQALELFDLSRDLAAGISLDDILKALVRHMEQTFGREVVVLLSESGQLKPKAASPDFRLEESELAVADWVYRNGEPAGRNTNTLPAARLRYLPLKTAHGVLCVLGVKGPEKSERHLTSEEHRLMEAFASQAALALERVRLAEQARQAQVLQATEKLQTALLNSISHDLRTPLVSITGALSTLQEDGAMLSDAARRSLVDNAHEEAERLNRLVGNLLDMTRIEAGALRVAEEPTDVQDLIGAALEQVAGRVNDRDVRVDVPADLPLVPLDFVLIVRVLANLLDNAVKYSTPSTPIEVHARLAGPAVHLEVADRGVGIPREDLERVFDKFYRVQQPHQVGGTGLGLSICKGIVEAHGGSIRASRRPGGGTLISIALPLRAAAGNSN